MHTRHYAEHTVDDIVHEVPEASHVLREFHVEAARSHELSITQAAEAVSMTADDMLAVMEYRLRRAAKQG